jgi:aspartyl-tRNA(Asn)/glutamyl-tRNA(Gln) amidotransferase subunit B
VTIVGEGGAVRQETRLWDSASGRTVAMRSKEESHDYRYFPEPDLPPLQVPTALIDEIRASLPELPEQRKTRFMTSYALPEYDARVLTQSAGLADYFEATARAAGNAKAASNWIMGELLRKMNALGVGIAAVGITPDALAGLIRLIDSGRISGAMAKDVFEKMYESGRSADTVVAEEGLAQISDESVLISLVRDVVSQHPGPVAQYRSGRTATFGFLVGQVMKAAGGKANPKQVNELLRRELDAS